MPSTPKIIHFIWVGAEKPLPITPSRQGEMSSHETLLAWQQKNQDFQVILWIDGSTTSQGSSSAFIDEYKKEDM